MASVRGNWFAAIQDMLKGWLTEEDYREFISGMRSPVAHAVNHPQTWEWYPTEYLNEIYAGIHGMAAERDGAIFEKMGSQLARAELGGAPKTRAALLPVPRVLARMSFLWSRCRDSGELSVTNLEPAKKRAEVEVSGFEESSHHLKVNQAWLAEVCRLLSGRRVKVTEFKSTHKAPARTCRWKISWE